MPSLAELPNYRINWRPDAGVLCVIPMAALISVSCIVVSGIPIFLQFILFLLVVAYALFSYRAYKKQLPFILLANTNDELLIVQKDIEQVFCQPEWRDWGFLIELSGRYAEKNHTYFWLSLIHI
jgi:hypothetical protein